MVLILQKVALRKESVDRNSIVWANIRAYITSLSARRAWIEMTITTCIASKKYLSLSARRAWIEIFGGVSARPLAACRSPQGERG